MLFWAHPAHVLMSACNSGRGKSLDPFGSRIGRQFMDSRSIVQKKYVVLPRDDLRDLGLVETLLRATHTMESRVATSREQPLPLPVLS